MRITFTTGKRLEPGEASPTGIYCLLSNKRNWPLRLTLMREMADLMRDEEWRYVAAAHITAIKPL